MVVIIIYLFKLCVNYLMIIKDLGGKVKEISGIWRRKKAAEMLRFSLF